MLCGVAILMGSTRSSGRRTFTLSPAVRRWAGALWLVLTIVWIADRRSTPEVFLAGIPIAMGLSCIFVDVVHAFASRVRTHNLPLLLASRRLVADPTSVASMAATVALVATPALCLAVMLSTMTNAMTNGMRGFAPEGLLYVFEPTGGPLREDLVVMLDDEFSESSSTLFRLDADPVRTVGTGSTLPQTYTRVRGTGSVLLAVESVADIERVSQTDLDASQEQALADGAVLFFASPSDDGQSTIDILRNDTVIASHDVPSVRVAVSPELAARGAGLTTAKTADRLGLARTTDGVFVDASNLPGLRQRMSTLGFDSSFVETYRAPDPVVPAPMYFAALGIAAAIAFVIVAALARQMFLAMEPYAEGLHAIGVSRLWTGRILLIETVLSMTLGIGGAVLATAAVTLLFRTSGSSVQLSVPWWNLILTLGICMACALAPIRLSRPTGVAGSFDGS